MLVFLSSTELTLPAKGSLGHVWLLVVLRFARETGDVHSLSTNDMKLLALALTLEQRQHGDKHVREHPVQVCAAHAACAAVRAMRASQMQTCIAACT